MFLPPLIAGGVIALLSSLITGWTQSTRDDRKFARERAAQAEDERNAIGAETARRVLEALVSLQHDVMRKQRPTKRGDGCVFLEEAVGRVMTDSKLLTDPCARKLTDGGMNCIQGAGAAAESLDNPVSVVQQSLVHHLQEIVSAYLRHDPLPGASVSYLERQYDGIAAVWETITGEYYRGKDQSELPHHATPAGPCASNEPGVADDDDSTLA